MNLRVALFSVGLICLVAGVFGQRRRPTIEDVITVPSRNAPPATASIAGTVVSEATALPVAGATVALSRRFENALLAVLSQAEPRSVFPPIRTDDNGKFLFEQLPAAEYGLAVRSELSQCPSD
jgi:hypothetical protein